uniref:Ovule protein n=1 Tax=Heterorhabditis bacteriophora TaxID=37862 RepID=A0A1I7XFM8_HETBA
MNQQPGYWHPVNDGNGNREGVSKQFQPKKYKEGNETWRMEKKEARLNFSAENIPHNGTLKPVNKNPSTTVPFYTQSDPSSEHST